MGGRAGAARRRWPERVPPARLWHPLQLPAAGLGHGGHAEVVGLASSCALSHQTMPSASKQLNAMKAENVKSMQAAGMVVSLVYTRGFEVLVVSLREEFFWIKVAEHWYSKGW